MNGLSILKRITFTLLIVLIAANLWGQATLSGEGTSSDPYQISSVENWNAFATAVNGGYDYNGKYVKLTADIGTTESPVTTMVGVWITNNSSDNKPFRGTFDGDNHTLTFSKGTDTPFNEEYCAPFRHIKGATIKNIIVAGNIVTSENKAAGLIGINVNASNVQNVTVSVNITANENCGGFAANGSDISFIGCIYNGTLTTSINTGGFCGIGSSKTTFENCLFKPNELSNIESGDNFSISRIGRVKNSYYTMQISKSRQGYRAYTTIPDNQFSNYKTLVDGNDYYVLGNAAITDVDNEYAYTGSHINITYTLTFDDKVLSKANYTVDLNGNDVTSNPSLTVTEKGAYTLTISGKNANDYYGSVSKTFLVVDAMSNGSGTEEDPYIIASSDDWNAFAERIKNGLDAGAYFRLDEDITVSTIVGTESKKFSGTFDGNWHKLTFNKGTDSQEGAWNQVCCAPFGYVSDATFKNLTVDGTIISSKKYAGGFVGYIYGNNSFINCTSNVTFNCTYIEQGASDKQYDCTYGGFIGQTMGTGSTTKVSFEYCLFEGEMIDNNSTKRANRCSGFIGWVTNGHKVTYTNCAMTGTINVKNNTATFNRIDKASINYNNAYYNSTTGITTVQGTQSPDSGHVPANNVSRKYNDRYVPCVVIGGIAANYTCTGNNIVIEPFVTYFGKKLEKNTNYTITYTPSEVNAIGKYSLTVTGASDYSGLYTMDFEVKDIDSWSDLYTMLGDAASGERNITLRKDIVAGAENSALEVNGSVILNLNGHTIDRGLFRADDKGEIITNNNQDNGYVIHVNAGASLTINGEGTITGGNNHGNGGGIYNEGNLVLNNVTVTRNNTERVDLSITGTGGGIYCASGSSFTMNGGYLVQNDGRGGGGGIHSYANPFRMNGVDVEWNRSEDKGGGVRVATPNGTTAYIINCTFMFNSATDRSESKGGGVYMEGTSNSSNLYMEECYFFMNTSMRQGGAFYSIRGTTYTKNCTMDSNLSYDQVGFESGDSFGGSVYLYADKINNQSTYIMDGGTINYSTTETMGGGIYVCEGALLKIKGNVKITECYHFDGDDNVDSNVYLNGPDDVIHVIGVLDPDAIIGVSHTGSVGEVVCGLNGNGTLLNFVLDNDTEHRLEVDDEGNVIVYLPFFWNQPEGWDGHITKTDNDYTIAATIIIPDGCVAEADNITLEEGGVIVIEEGGQLVYNDDVQVTVKKNIQAATTIGGDYYGWYSISSPVNNAQISGIGANTNITTAASAYDLLYYDEPTHYWRSYQDHDDFTHLTNGQGYLYRKSTNLDLEFIGNINTSDVVYTLSSSSSDGKLKGFNLIGNPYTHNIYKNDFSHTGGDEPAINDANLGVGFYKIYMGDYKYGNEWVACIGSDPIKPCEGILVQTDTGHDLTIANTTNTATYITSPSSKGARESGYGNIMFEVSNSKYNDIAYALFGEGIGLNKIEHNNPETPMIYISQYEQDYAVAAMNDKTKEFALNFKAASMGEYTLSVKSEGEFSYIHLYDKLTGMDVDMLADGTYSFIGSSADSEDRFIVRLSEATGNEGGDSFAYQSGSDIFVSGDGELQVFDVTGRMVSRIDVNGIETVNTSSLKTGVYILRLIGSEIKTQKIVVR